MKAARDVPPKGATQGAALADAPGRAPTPKTGRIVDASDDAHARSLWRDRKGLCAFRRPAPASRRSAPSITQRLTIEEHERDGDDEEEHLIEWAGNRC
jgi:hypothetical protein